MAKQEWDLTEEEIKDFKEVAAKKDGLNELLEQLMEIGYHNRLISREVWRRLHDRLGISENERQRLFTSHETGKAWLKDAPLEVREG